MQQLVKKRTENTFKNEENSIKTSNSSNCSILSTKRKYNEIDNEVKDTELMLLDGISLSKNKNKVKSKKQKEFLNEEKQLKLEQEKVLNIELLLIKCL